MSGRLVALAAAGLALASCASAPRTMTPAEASVVVGTSDAAKVPLTAEARARLRTPYLAQRAAMVADIRTDLRQQAASADTPAFDRALAEIAARRASGSCCPPGDGSPMSTCRSRSAGGRPFPILMSLRS